MLRLERYQPVACRPHLPRRRRRVPSRPESAILEEHSPQPNNDMALVDSHLPVESSASTVEENPAACLASSRDVPN